MLPKALSKALGISLSEVLEQYYNESDVVKRGCLIGNALDRKWMGEEDQEWLDCESKRLCEIEVSFHRQEDDTY
jgi:hypothetical protein